MLLFVGGTRSGKSALALRWADAQAERRLFVAGCVPEDAEMAARVARHKAERGPSWECMEESLDPRQALKARFRVGDRPDVILYDCVSTWLANMLYAGFTPEGCQARVSDFAEYLGGLGLPVGLVTTETGLGLVPSNPIGRVFQDTLGLINQTLARFCHTVVFVSCGLPLPLKGVLPGDLC